MLKHYLKTVLRSLLKHKAFSLINILGLAIGIGCCLLVSLWVFGQMGYDAFHEHLDTTYRVFTQGITRDNPATPAPLAPALQEEFPEIEYATRFESFSTSLFRYEDRAFLERGIYAADPSFFDVFSFAFARGEASAALSDMYSLVITEEVARKYFNEEDPIGKVLIKDGNVPFTVTAVLKDIPVNSSFQFDMLVPFEYRIVQARETTGWDMNWGWFSPATYVKIGENCAAAEIEPKISEFFCQRVDEEGKGLTLMPFAEYHFYRTGARQYIFIYSSIALLVLIMACINFVNLSTARFSDRAREIGVRKVVGASRRNMYLLLLGESVTVSLAALFIGTVLVELAVGAVQAATGMRLYLGFMDIPYFLPGAVLMAILIGILAGSYPAFYLSSLRPIAVMKGNLKAGRKGLYLRRILVVIQFSCSVLLIVGTAVIFKQLDYVTEKDLGYAQDQIINIPLRGDTPKSYPVLKNELSKDQAILRVSGSASNLPFWQWTTGAVSWDGKDPSQEVSVGVNYVDHGFIETAGIEIVAGRSFSEEFPADLVSGYLVNEEMVKLMGLDSPVGANLTYIDNSGQIVGVMKNFHWRPLDTPMRPLIFRLVPEQTKTIAIRVPEGNVSATLESIKATWERVVPDYPFEYWFVRETIDRAYAGVGLIGSLAGGLAFIAVVVACLGLLGLASFMAEKRTQEIGVRKVLGASVWSIVRLLSREHLILALLACLLTFPVIYLVMNSWLSNFAYHTSLTAMDFLLAVGMAFFMIVVSAGFQSVRAATSNPADVLRSE